MRYSFRLAQLLGHVPDPRKRPGTIKSIVEHTGLDRHQVAALLKNEVKYVPLKALSRLCDYLIEHGYMSADQLPGALFAIEPENFWELLARRRRLELCLGVRSMEQQGTPEGSLVMASDSVLLGEMLNGVTTLGGTAKHLPPSPEANNGVPPSPAPHPEHLKQSLVWSPEQGSDEEVKSRALEVYGDFEHSVSDKALICLGSMKSNPVWELTVATAFGCEPFVSQQSKPQPTERACPFFVRYRDFDPKVTSCCGGMQLSQSVESNESGIYFEKADGSWDHCGWSPTKDDVAIVFYIHREAQGWLEMAIGGYSGRATRLLAKTLATRAEDFWPPVYEDHGIQVGAFVVKYTLPESVPHSHDILRTDLVAGTTVIRLAPEVIERRLAPV